MNNTQITPLTIPLGGQAHHFARQFAAQQATPQKGKRVYFNTLAVYAVHSYLKWLQIETNLCDSDCWHPGKRAVFDIADLAVPDIGKLECRPILPGETVCLLPLEVLENRIGYVGVLFSESLSEVELLGFAPAVDAVNPPEQLGIADFKPLDALIDHLNQLKFAITSGAPSDEADAFALREISISRSQRQVNLSQWFQDTFEASWQTVEAILGTEKARLAFRFRSANQFREIQPQHPEASVQRSKLIDLGLQLAGHAVALVVAIRAEIEQEVDILIQLHPAGELTYLPPLLKLIVFDEAGTTLKAEARSADNYIQLQFSGNPGERFSVKVALGDISITEDFVI